MTHYKIAVTLLITLLLINVTTAQQIISAKTESFSKAKGIPSKTGGYPDFDLFEFSLAGFKYEIRHDGKGNRTKDKSSQSFKVALDIKTDYFARIYSTEFKGDLLLLCEGSNGPEAYGFITRFDGRTLKPKWRIHIAYFNVGNGLIEGGYAYLTAIGWIAKINLDTGKFIWKHDDLYERDDSTNNFDLPKVNGKYVLFPCNGKTIKVQKQSGKIISIS